jgi:hypothetical protein
MIDNATISLLSCTFNDMSTFVFLSNATVKSTFNTCTSVTVGGGTFTDCAFNNLTAASHIIAASPAHAALISNSVLNSDGTGNGIEITGTAADITLNGIDFIGYSTTVDADKAIFVNIATGSMTINISGGSGVTAASHVRTAGCTITVSADLSITLSPLVTGSVASVYLTGTSTLVAETLSSGTSFNFAVPISTAVDIVIFEGNEDDAQASIPVRIENKAFTVDQTVSINQLSEPNFIG